MVAPGTSGIVLFGAVQDTEFVLLGLLHGEQTLTIGKERDGEIPVTIKASSVRLPEASLQSLGCICIRSVEVKTCGGTLLEDDGSAAIDCTPELGHGDVVCTGRKACSFVYGRGNSASGTIGCDGLSGTNLDVSLDALDQTSAPSVQLQGSAGPGAALIDTSLAFSLIMQDCDESTEAFGPDHAFCTADDPPLLHGPILHVPLTTGTARASILNARGADGQERALLGPFALTGAPFDCEALATGNSAGASLSTGVTLLDQGQVGDVAGALMFAVPFNSPTPEPSATPIATPEPGQQFAYVSSSGSDAISVLDGTTSRIIATIRTGTGIHPTAALAISPADGRIYVGGPNRIYVIEPPTTLVSTIALDRDSSRLAVSDDGRLLFVLDDSLRTISIIDTVTLATAGTVELMNGFVDWLVARSFDRLYVLDPHGVSVVDSEAGRVVERIPIDGQANAIALSPTGDTLYVAFEDCPSGPCYFGTPPAIGIRSGALTPTPPGPTPTATPCIPCRYGVHVIHAANGNALRSIPLPRRPTSIAIGPDGGLAYVTDSVPYPYANDSARLSVINLATEAVATTVPIPTTPRRVFFGATGHLVYVQGQTILILDTDTLQIVKALAVQPLATLGLSPDGALLYLAEQGSLSILNASTAATVDRVDGTPPNDVVISPDGSRAYVPLADGSTAVFDTARHEKVASIPVSGGSIAITPDGTQAYLSPCGDGICILELVSESIAGTIPLEGFAGKVAFSPDGSFAWVTNGPFVSGTELINVATRARARFLPGFAGITFAPDGHTAYARTTEPTPAIAVIGVAAGRVIDRIELEANQVPSLIAFAPDSSIAYITLVDRQSGSTALAFVRVSTGMIETTIPISVHSISDIDVTSDGTRVYLTDTDGPNRLSDVIVVDSSDRAVVERIPVAEAGLRLAFGVRRDPTASKTPDEAPSATPTHAAASGRELAYVASYGDRPLITGSVNVIDTATRAVIDTIPIPQSQRALAMSPDGTRVYATDINRHVAVIDTAANEVIATVTVGGGPASVAVTPDGRFAYVANASDNSVSVVDTASNLVTKTIPVVYFPRRIAISPDGRSAYVTGISRRYQDRFGNGLGAISVIDISSARVSNEIPVGDAASDVAFSRADTRAYVSAFGAGLLSVIDSGGAQPLGIIPINDRPFALALRRDGTLAYVTHVGPTQESRGSVSVVDLVTRQPLAQIDVGARPFAIALTAEEDFAYVTSEFSDEVAVIDTDTYSVVQTINGIDGPQDIVIGHVPHRVAASPTLEPTPTPSPTVRPGDLGDRQVYGIVYDSARGPTAPISGAEVAYLHTSFFRPSARDTIRTDAEGAFRFRLFLHDTDSVELTASAAGFQTASVRQSGLALWLQPQVNIELEPWGTAIPSPTRAATATPSPQIPIPPVGVTEGPRSAATDDGCAIQPSGSLWPLLLALAFGKLLVALFRGDGKRTPHL